MWFVCSSPELGAYLPVRIRRGPLLIGVTGHAQDHTQDRGFARVSFQESDSVDRSLGTPAPLSVAGLTVQLTFTIRTEYEGVHDRFLHWSHC